eukprot:COSAG06_NODE_29484_length_555_cov_1.390351_2_plen_102_part_01
MLSQQSSAPPFASHRPLPPSPPPPLLGSGTLAATLRSAASPHRSYPPYPVDRCVLPPRPRIWEPEGSLPACLAEGGVDLISKMECVEFSARPQTLVGEAADG